MNDRNSGLLRLSGEVLTCQRGGRQVFADLDFSVSSGEMLAVIGPNGAGKSSLLRIIAGFLNPVSGHIRLTGTSSELADSLHFLSHQDTVKAGMTAIRDLEFWTRYWGGSGAPGAALETVGLGNLADVPANVLSAGQKRRLAMARLLTVRRPLWLLDEPTSALDAASESMLGGLMADHLARGGLIVAATHQSLPVEPTMTLTLERAKVMASA